MIHKSENKVHVVRNIFYAFALTLLMAFAVMMPGIQTEAASGNMQITPIDFGPDTWGDATIVSSGGQNLLMDTCNTDKNNTIINYLSTHNFFSFDIYISHYHYDHFYQVVPIINDSRFHVSTIYMPDPAYLKKGADNSSYCDKFYDGYQNVVDAARAKGIRIVYLKKGSSFTIGGAKFEVLWGCNYNNGIYDTHYINNNSLVTKVTAGDVTYLTCGDIENAVESQIVSSGIDITADIFKMSHHGGNTSNSYSFVKKVNPSFTYYNYCDDTPTTFGSAWALSSINNMKSFSNIYSSRYNGMLTFTVKNGHISVAGERNMKSVTVDIKNSAGAVVNCVNYQFNNALDYHITARMKATAANASTADATTTIPARFKAGTWKQDSKGWYYIDSDGKKVTSSFYTLSGNTYYFGSDGYMRTGWVHLDGKYYYFASSGAMYYRWKRVDGKKYLFDYLDGHMHTGWVYTNGDWYYLDAKKGYLAEGWVYYLNKWYYMNPGSFEMVTNEWVISDGAAYYMGSDGLMLKNTTRTIRGRSYTFGADGKALNLYSFGSSDNKKNWDAGTDSDLSYNVSTKRNADFVSSMLLYATYFDSKISYGSSQNGTDSSGLRYLHLRDNGTTDCSWFVYHVLRKFGLVGSDFIHSYEWGNKPSTYPGAKNIGNDISKASPGDIICTGTGTKPQNSHVAIYLGNGKIVECGDPTGVKVANAPSNIRQIVHFTCLPTGSSNSSNSVNDSSSSTKTTSNVAAGEWKKDSTGWWYRLSNGSYPKNTFKAIGGNTYYFNERGYMVTGWQTIGGKKYYFDSDGALYLRWKRVDGKKYLFDQEDGHMHTGWTYVTEKSKWYYLSPETGYLLEGLQKIGGNWYYLEPGDGYMHTGWQTIDGKKYYFDSNGAMYLRWKRIDGKKYFFDAADGHMHTGWTYVSEQGKWYYLSPKDGYLVEGWQKIGSAWYYMKPTDYYMVTGWQKIGSHWYYMEPSSGKMVTGWKKIGKTWYYMNSSGAMVTGTQRIGGTTYKFANSGAWIG